jgi:ABC-type glycerol-3-phosphate transport system substrate-binding protein
MQGKKNLAGMALAVAMLALAGPATAGEIVYWSMWNDSEPSAKEITALAKKYMDAHPDTKVSITFNGRQNQVKVRTALTGGTTIDLVDGELDNLAGGLVSAGQVEPFDALLATPGPDGGEILRPLPASVARRRQARRRRLPDPLRLQSLCLLLQQADVDRRRRLGKHRVEK